MDPSRRTLLRVTINDMEMYHETCQTFSILMGDEVEPRKKFHSGTCTVYFHAGYLIKGDFSLNRDDLQLFMTILEENNLIKAAEQLYLSPSTAGSRLRAMEEELGYPLFERRKGVKSALPTSRGLAFSHIASQMLALWNEADQIGGMSDSPFLTIATVDSFLDYNLTPFYRELISLHGFSLDIKCYPADMIYSLVSSKQADVGFALYDISTPHVNVTPLSEDDMVLVVPEGSGLIPAEDCPAQPVHPSVLPPDRELFTGSSANSNIGWGPQFKLWHDRYIRSGSRPW